MALIRECQPQSLEEWENWYFGNAYTETKKPIKVTREVLTELGERLHVKFREIVIPQLEDAINAITEEDCIEYVFQLTINRTYDGFMTEKSVVHGSLAKIFGGVEFRETDPELDHAGDIDYLGIVGAKAFGIQIKPVTANANLGNLSVTARMEESFRDFEDPFGGKVFIVFSMDGRIANEQVTKEIEEEIERLRSIQ